MGRRRPIAVVAPSVLVAAATGAAAAGPMDRAHGPVFAPATFVRHVDNPWFPLPAGRTLRYRGQADHVPGREVLRVTHRTRTILGVRSTVVHDRLFARGRLAEDTLDYYARQRVVRRRGHQGAQPARRGDQQGGHVARRGARGPARDLHARSSTRGGVAPTGAGPRACRRRRRISAGDAGARGARRGSISAWDGPQAIICADSPARHPLRAWPEVIARLTRVSRIGGPFVGWTGWAPCASWPVRDADRYTGPWNATTRNPILVIGTRFDPATPYANARRVARLFGNAVLLTHDGYGHTSEADPSRCVQRATSAYLVKLRAPRRGTICPSDRQPFDPEFGRPSDRSRRTGTAHASPPAEPG
jgi:hypothetical protein